MARSVNIEGRERSEPIDVVGPEALS